MKTIEVTIDEGGKIEVVAKGFQGRGCTDATKLIRDALGATTDDKKTPDYYKEEKVKTTQRT